MSMGPVDFAGDCSGAVFGVGNMEIVGERVKRCFLPKLDQNSIGLFYGVLYWYNNSWERITGLRLRKEAYELSECTCTIYLVQRNL